MQGGKNRFCNSQRKLGVDSVLYIGLSTEFLLITRAVSKSATVNVRCNGTRRKKKRRRRADNDVLLLH